MKHFLAPALSIAVLLAPVQVQAQTPVHTSQETPTMAKVTHTEWSKLLGKYVETAPDGVNRVDYAALKASDADMEILNTYIERFESIDIDDLTKPAQIAAWSNLYNAVTVRYIVSKYPTDSIRSGYLFSGPWKRIKVRAGGQEVSLDGIEHDILRHMDEPRIHYAINCAAYTCPNLLPKAFTAKSLNKDLDDAARAYINHPRGVTVTERGLILSEIYNWFEEDFGGSKADVLSHLQKYAAPDLSAQIEANPKIRKYAYDWSLNDTQ